MGLMDVVHGVLDVAGFIPVVGAVADLANAAIYAAEGDWGNAALSAVSAVPGFGDAVGAVKILAKSANALGKALPKAKNMLSFCGKLTGKAKTGAKKLANKVKRKKKAKKAKKEAKKNAAKNKTSLDDRIRQAELAQKKAGDLSDKYGYSKRPKKTIASDGTTNTLSGWKKLDENSEFTRASVEDVFHKSNEIGHKLRNAGACDQGIPGRYNASHAEKQLSVLSDKPIGISQPMCKDCQDYFKKLSVNEGKEYVTADPETIRIFKPDGSVQEIKR